jgi:hypothetical protein
MNAIAGALAVLFCGALACSGSGSSNRDPLIGSWTFSGSVPDLVTVTLTLSPDKTFTMLEAVAPPTLPAGTKPTSCMTMDTPCLHGLATQVTTFTKPD